MTAFSTLLLPQTAQVTMPSAASFSKAEAD
jgi:hypothetical protein